MESWSTQQIRRTRWLLVAVFLIERMILYLAGLRCQLEGLSWYWQILNLDALKHHLLQSLLHLHAQPPLFNLLTGLLLKTGAGMWIFSLFCTLEGLLMCLILFELLADFGWSPRSRLILLSLLPLLPAWILYEQWYFYDFPTALFLALAALSLRRWGTKARAGYLFLYLGSLTGLAALRSIFHLLWLVPAIFLAVFARRPESLRLKTTLLIPLILIGGWYAKNDLLFGFFGSSSWMGLSLAKMTTMRLPPEETRELVRRQVLSPLALVRKPFAPIRDYEEAAGIEYPDPADRALGVRVTPDGHRNYNHLAYVKISSICRKDALTVIRRRPAIYLNAIRISVHCFFGPVSAYPAFRDNLGILAPIAKLEIFGWDSRLFSILFFVICLVRLTYKGIGELRSGNSPLAAVYTFALFCIVWVFMTGNMLEIGENERFRFMIFPLLLIAVIDSAKLSQWLQQPISRAQRGS